MNARGRRVVLVAVLAVALVGAAFAGAAWYLLGEARRTGRLVATVLSSRTGLPTTVARAWVDGPRLHLVDVRFAAGPLQVRVAEVDVTGGVLPLVVSASRPLSVVAVAATVRVEAGAAGLSGGAAPESARAALRALLDWPGLFNLRVEEGRLQTAAAPDHRFRLVADKDSSGLTFALTVGPPEHPAAVTLNVRARPLEDDGASGVVELNVEPARLGVLWPDAVPGPPKIAVRADVQLPRGGDLAARGRATLGAAQRTPAVIDFTASYESARQRLGVSRYTLDWGADLHLAGDAEMTATPNEGAMQVTARGTVDGSSVSAHGVYQRGTGALQAELDLASVDAGRLGRRLGLAPLPMTVTARRLVARVSGPEGGAKPVATVTVRADAVTTTTAPKLAVDAVLDARLRLAGMRLAAVDDATLRLDRGGALAMARFSSRSATLWPLAIDARVDDLGRLGAVFPAVPALSGWVRFAGEARGGERPDVQGRLEAQLPRAQVMADASVLLTDVRVTLPVAWGGGEDTRPGSVTASRVSGYGVALTDLTSTAQLRGPRVFLPDIQYAQYGGRGKGWLEAFVDDRPMPLRTRLEGEKVDLAEFVREAGWQVARMTGRARYVAAAQYERAGGFTAAVHVNSEGDGGEVSIEVIERLLDSATVQAESTGVLRQALENLRVFSYESMEGDLRAQGATGHLDLSLRGRKRLGIFPAPVEAINFRNVPLPLLARTLGRSNP
ncbi:MAG TPA: hypothetical protein VID04_05080 [Methylomirabilota bacterium]